MSFLDTFVGAMPIVGAATGVADTIISAVNADKNLKFQEKTLDYEKQAQQTTWNREDTAVQRRVADLKKAGLSPVLAAGSAASTSAPIHVTTPHVENVETSTMMDKAMVGMALMRAKADISRTEAENELIRINAAKADQELWRLRHDNNLLYTTGAYSSGVAGGILNTAYGYGPKLMSAVKEVGGKAIENLKNIIPSDQKILEFLKRINNFGNYSNRNTKW